MRCQPRELGYRNNWHEPLSRVVLHDEIYTIRNTELSEYGSCEMDVAIAAVPFNRYD